jgi:hypothetical protein
VNPEPTPEINSNRDNKPPLEHEINVSNLSASTTWKTLK